MWALLLRRWTRGGSEGVNYVATLPSRGLCAASCSGWLVSIEVCPLLLLRELQVSVRACAADRGTGAVEEGREQRTEDRCGGL